MQKIYTTADVVAKTSCHRVTVSRVAYRIGAGMMVGTRSWIFDTRDFKAICKAIRKKSGNPNFVAGNKLGKRKKKLAK